MDGPAHYQEAERLLRLADTEPDLVAVAAVHTALAQVAATANLADIMREAHIQSTGDMDYAWQQIVLGKTPR